MSTTGTATCPGIDRCKSDVTRLSTLLRSDNTPLVNLVCLAMIGNLTRTLVGEDSLVHRAYRRGVPRRVEKEKV